MRDSRRAPFPIPETDPLSLEYDAEGPLSRDALAHLRGYKYSSIDKSYISRYILKHYVCKHPIRNQYEKESVHGKYGGPMAKG